MSSNPHRNEIIRWAKSPVNTEVWTRAKNCSSDLDKVWHLLSAPQWVKDNYYVVDDMYATLRKAFFDGETIEYLYANGIWRETSNLDWCQPLEKYRIKPEFNYPMWFKSNNSELVVKFTDLKEGVIVIPNPRHRIGDEFKDWVAHTNADIWTQIDEPKFEYPMWFASTEDELLVKFTNLRKGTVITPNSTYKVGDEFEDWVPHTNIDIWTQVDEPVKSSNYIWVQNKYTKKIIKIRESNINILYYELWTPKVGDAICYLSHGLTVDTIINIYEDAVFVKNNFDSIPISKIMPFIYDLSIYKDDEN